jgi:integrase
MLRVAHSWDRGRHGWYVRFFRNGRRRSSKVGPPGPEGEAKARAWVEAYEARVERERLWERGPDQPLPIDELVRTWRSRHAPLRSRRTQITDYGLVEHLARHFGGLDARSLTDERIAEFAAAIVRSKRSGHVASNALSLLRRAINLAVKGGLLERNPVAEWSAVMRQARGRTTKEASARDAWSRDEAAAMLALAYDKERWLSVPLLAAFHSGARRGELLALRWEDVDFDQKRIHFRRTVEAGKGHKTKLPKASRGRLTPLSAVLAEALLLHRKSQRRATLRGVPDVALVFPSPRGNPWGERNFSRTFQRLRKRFSEVQVRPLPFHCTRHTYITWALNSGVPAKVVSDWTGVSVSVIEKHYAHAIQATWNTAFLDGGTWSHKSDTSEKAETDASARSTMVIRARFERATPSFGGSGHHE